MNRMNRSRRNLRALLRLSRTHYPGFIFGLPVTGGTPVFTYHDVEPKEFAGDLEFLARNGYRTLGLDEFVATRKNPPGRCVLLTFDDARKSFYTVALPLLRQYRARATLFVPSYWMGADLFMSWAQVRECRESGLVDVESHAHRHALVFTSQRLVDFATPAALARFDIYDWPMRSVDGADELGLPQAGTPIYAAEPLLSAARRYVENTELAQACREFVRQGGGAEFFKQPGALKSLAAFHGQRAARLPGQFLPEEAFVRLAASEFECCREAFRTHLGFAPRYLAYPWMLGSRRSLELARRAGIEAAFGVALDYRAARDHNLPIAVFGRLKCEWLRFLPGTSRANVLGAIKRKLKGFRQTQHLAH